jgi:hypothetical protein
MVAESRASFLRLCGVFRLADGGNKVAAPDIAISGGCGGGGGGGGDDNGTDSTLAWCSTAGTPDESGVLEGWCPATAEGAAASGRRMRLLLLLLLLLSPPLDRSLGSSCGTSNTLAIQSVAKQPTARRRKRGRGKRSFIWSPGHEQQPRCRYHTHHSSWAVVCSLLALLHHGANIIRASGVLAGA